MNNKTIDNIEELESVLNGIQELLVTGVTEIMTDSADDIVNNTKKRTNRITGKLQDSWQHEEVKVNKKGNFSVEIGSDCEYAKFVEEGHRQEVGRYVPAIGKKLKAPFVKGKHMLGDSITQEEDNLQKNIDELLKDVFE